MWHKYINGNCVIKINDIDGTKIRETLDDEFRPAFAENIDIKISDRCDMSCPFCHEGCSRYGSNAVFEGDFWQTFHPYQEVAVGGGNIFANPHLDYLLHLLRDQKVFANITVHQEHFCRYLPEIKKYYDAGLIYGIGISVNEAISQKIIDEIKQFPTAVLHVINGIFTQKLLEKIQCQDMKILILGYKELRRGRDYLINSDTKTAVKNSQRWLVENIRSIIQDNMFGIVSFDNLAIEQLDIRSILAPPEWEKFYMGDDGSFTFYIDAVNNRFAINSTAPESERYDCLNSVDEMFGHIQKR